MGSNAFFTIVGVILFGLPQFIVLNILILAPYRLGKTVFAISYENRYFYIGDRLIKLDYGEVESDNRLNTSNMALM